MKENQRVGPLIAVDCSEMRGGSQDQLDSLKFVQPLLDDMVLGRIGIDDQSRGTGSAGRFTGHFSISGQGAIAITPHQSTLFAEKHQLGHSRGATDCQFFGQFQIGVPVNKPKVDRGRFLLETAKDGALLNAVTAPGACHA
jgi:hypothetical protein